MHPKESALAALVAGALSADERRRLLEHLEECARCGQRVLELGGTLSITRPPPVAVDDPDASEAANPSAAASAPGTLDPPAKAQDPGAQVTAPWLSALPDLEVAETHIGRYQLLQHVASGGMGSVYTAYDPELDRRVALKLLHRSRGSRDEWELRLQREAKAMARLAHPNVVTVHDVGTYEGRVFLAMEYIEGGSLKQWLAGGRRSWQEIRGMFVEAARGLAAAHQVGLVHRDFKPDNVLIGAGGRVKVADFGLARGVGESTQETPQDMASRGPEPAPPPSPPHWSGDALDASLTASGVVVGTVSYMAPEQVLSLPSDGRTDQFAFGVSLYEALYGVRPFPDKNPLARLDAMERGILREPRQDHGAPDWLGQVVRRMLRPKSSDRYGSMDEVLSELQRDLRRKRLGPRAAVAIGAVALLAVAVPAVALRNQALCRGADRQLEGAWDASSRAKVSAAFGADQETFQRTAEVLDRYARDWVVEREDACAAARIRRDQTEAVLALRTGCLDLRLKELHHLVALLGAADAALAGQAVDAALGLSSVRSCGDTTALTSAVPPPEDPTLRASVDQRFGLLAEANALRLAGKYREALDQARAAVGSPEAQKHPPLLAEALYLEGVLEERMGRTAEADSTLVAAVAAADTGRVDVLRARAASLLVYQAALSSRFQEGRRWAALAAAALKRTGGSPQYEGELSSNLGTLARGEGKLEEARDAYERSVKLLEHDLGPDRPAPLIARANLANVYVDLHQPEKAEPILEEAIPRMSRLRGARHPTLVGPLSSLTRARLQLKAPERALETAEQALGIARAAYGNQNLRVAGCLEWKATVLQALGRDADAFSLYRESLAIKQQLLPATDPRLSFPRDGIGQSLLGMGRAAEAVPELEAALALRGPLPEDRADTEFGLARALGALGKDRRRALELAGRARADYAAAGRKDRAGDVERWLQQR